MSFLTPCALFHLFPVIVSQVVFAQNPQVQTLSVGSIFKVDCHTARLIVGNVNWYKRQHREPLQLVYTVGKQAPPEGRFSGQVNDEYNIYSLIVKDVQRNDSGVYYCAVQPFSLMPLRFGNGSKLFIAGSPEIFLLTPPPDEIPSLERVPLMCLVRSLSPDSLPIRWNVSGWVTEEPSDSGTIDPDGTYTVRSQISVSAETWSSGAVCTCAVPINSTGDLISESVSSQRESPLQTSCRLLLYGSWAAALLLLLMVIVAAGRSCRNRRSGNSNSDQKLTDSRPRAQDKETLYAHLAFNAVPTP